MKQHFAQRRTGFSLVEVMLALAIVSLGIVAILGLLPSGLQAGRDAADNTLSATIVQDIFSNLRAGSFTNATVCDTCAILQNLGTYSNAGNPVVDYYDYAGFSTNQAAAYYRVVLTYTPQPMQVFPPQSPSLTRVTATVFWPAQSKKIVGSSVFVTQIARYDR